MDYPLKIFIIFFEVNELFFPLGRYYYYTMRKLVTILEIPIYLLVIGVCCLEHGNPTIGVFLLGMSIIRLWVNHITCGE